MRVERAHLRRFGGVLVGARGEGEGAGNAGPSSRLRKAVGVDVVAAVGERAREHELLRLLARRL